MHLLKTIQMQQPQRSFTTLMQQILPDAKLKRNTFDIADDAKEHAEHIADNLKNSPSKRNFCSFEQRHDHDIKTFGTKKIISRLLSNVRSR
jgi:hypothetical protein